MRRYFYDIHVSTNAPIAGEALQRIGQLFDVERMAMGLPCEQRRRVRQSAARPLIDDLATFLDASLAMISGRSELAKAIRYARSRWTAFSISSLRWAISASVLAFTAWARAATASASTRAARSARIIA